MPPPYRSRRTNRAKLFRNRRKQEPWQSDFAGKVTLENGAIYRVGVTLRTASNGEEYLSIYLMPRSI
jgi:hypothetical protein